MEGNTVVAPRGTIVYASLLAAQSASNTAGGELELDLTDIKINDQIYFLATPSIQAQGSEGSSGGMARGAGTGAVLGAVTGPGVITGSAVGATVGGMRRGPTRGQNVTVPADTLV